MAFYNNATSMDSSYFDEFGSINRITLIHCRRFKRHPKSHMSVSSESSLQIESLSSESAQHIASNEDILTEILLHLPPKSLLRFQTVSKHWLSIISSPVFRRLHTRKNAKSSASTIGFFLCRNPIFNFLSLNEEDLSTMSMMNKRFSSIHNGKIFYHMNSCNGLFCLDFKFSNGKREFYVYNFTTGKHRLIPLPNTVDEPHLVKTMNLAFDPEKSEDYNVVCVWLSVSENQLRFAVYSSGVGIWKHSTACYDCNEYGAVDLCCDYGVFLNGAVHWVSQTGPFLCFEVGNCSFRSMPTTPIPQGQWHRDIEYFGESGGHLQLIGQNSDQRTKVDILELEVDYSGWFIKYHVNLDFLPNLYPAVVNQEVNLPEDYAYSNVFSTICFLDDEEDKARLFLSLPGKIILYNLGDGMIKELADVKPASVRHFLDGARYDGLDMYKHVETLACV
ncbi:F-box protein At5g07610-like [Lycium ferocissimum]|uniref:F-box protein At5g07610-like n=1 Tax=Lycium ferocissimum TaxID=112874 RepID=UPI0028163F8A|nr:F-box protein At5g07610-like [Lycium ferocissimum]